MQKLRVPVFGQFRLKLAVFSILDQLEIFSRQTLDFQKDP